MGKEEPKTPWNPSRRATARVVDPIPAPESCNVCDTGEVEIVNNAEIYGRSYGEWPWAYRCKACEAYVGMHPFTAIPLGTLADAETREARKRAKSAFNPIWVNKHMNRTQAYAWLASEMGLTRAQCHIGLFNQDQCREVVRLSVAYLRSRASAKKG